MALRRVKVFFDGGCRPWPAGMVTAVVVRGHVAIRCDRGPGSAMEAEWLALLHAVETVDALGVPAPLLLGDALAVINQANGVARCPPRFMPYLMRLRAHPSLPRIRYVKRAQNLAGIALARAADRTA